MTYFILERRGNTNTKSFIDGVGLLNLIDPVNLKGNWHSFPKKSNKNPELIQRQNLSRFSIASLLFIYTSYKNSIPELFIIRSKKAIKSDKYLIRDYGNSYIGTIDHVTKAEIIDAICAVTKLISTKELKRSFSITLNQAYFSSVLQLSPSEKQEIIRTRTTFEKWCDDRIDDINIDVNALSAFMKRGF
jgi:hypothetical protein